MRYFDDVLFMSEKRDVQGRQRFLARFVSGLCDRLKNLSAAVNATKAQSRFAKREGT